MIRHTPCDRDLRLDRKVANTNGSALAGAVGSFEVFPRGYKVVFCCKLVAPVCVLGEVSFWAGVNSLMMCRDEKGAPLGTAH